jgi:hypothetical protein
MKKDQKEISLNRPVKIDPKEDQNRRDLMATMAEMSRHLPNVSPEKQELVAQFMVEQLRGAVNRTEPFGSNPNPQEKFKLN